MEFHEEIKKLERLLFSAKYEEGIKLAFELESHPQISKSAYLAVQLLRLNIYIDASRFEEAETFIETLLNANPRNPVIIDVLILKTLSFFYRGRREEAIQVVKESSNLLSLQPDNKSKENLLRFAYIEMNRARGLWFNGEYKEAKLVIENSIKILEDFKEKKFIGGAYMILGNNLFEMGDLDESIKTYELAYKLSEKIGYIKIMLWNLTNLGEVYRLQGNLNKALTNFETSLSLLEEQKVQSFALVVNLVNIGYVYNQKGHLDEALRYFTKGLEISEKLDMMVHKALILAYIGMVHKQKGDLSQALDFFKRCLALQLTVGKPMETAQFLLEIISILLTRSEIDEARKYMKQLQVINKQEKNRVITQKYRLAEGLLLKASHRGRDRIKASEIFQELQDEGLHENEYQIFTMINLTECLLDELRAFGELEVLREITQIIEKIYSLSQKQNTIPLIINSLILKAKLSLIKGNLEKSEILLDDAIATAKKQKLDFLIKTSQEEKNHLMKEYDKWQTLIESNASFKTRLEEAKIENYIHMARNLVFAESREKG